jgi:hypothetical protein
VAVAESIAVMVTVAVMTVMVVVATVVAPARFHLEFHVQVILRQHSSLAGPPGTPARFDLTTDVVVALAAMVVVSAPARFHLASAFLECAWHVRLPVKGVGVAKRALSSV